MMFLKLTILILVALDLAAWVAGVLRGRGTENTTIIGGTTQTTRIPYFVHYTGGRCAGTLITGDMVLTAADCVDTQGFPESVRIAPLTTSDGTTVSVDTGNSVINPFWRGDFFAGSDVALLKLSSTVSTSEFPVVQLNQDCLAPVNGATLTLYGFGFTSPDGPDISTTLQTLSTNMQCAGSTDEYIGLFASDTMGACNGDSGGPAVTGNVQFGIASFVIDGCTSGNPDGYARISTYYSWIQLEVCRRASDTTNFSCGTAARLRRAVADVFSKVYFGAHNSLASVASTFGFGVGKLFSKDDIKVFPMGNS